MKHHDRFLLAGVMGWPVMHSRSPLMHNYWFKQQDLAGAYVPLAIKPGTVSAALRALQPLGFAGCNVTIPHKQEAMAAIDEVDDIARRIGAVSCVAARADGTLFGTNNDWIGFIDSIKDEHPGWRATSGPVAVIGAGGGARAVCYGLLREGAPEIRLVNRTHARAEELAAEFGAPIRAVRWQQRADALEGVALVVNTTSQGMVGQAALDLPLDRLPRSALAADIVYVPLETPFLAAARARGNPTLNGLGMLIHQGRPAWRLWFGMEPFVTEELRQLMEQSIRG